MSLLGAVKYYLGLDKTPILVFYSREDKCSICPYQDEFRPICTVCKCPVMKKAAVNSETCPKGYWTK